MLCQLFTLAPPLPRPKQRRASHPKERAAAFLSARRAASNIYLESATRCASMAEASSVVIGMPPTRSTGPPPEHVTGTE